MKIELKQQCEIGGVHLPVKHRGRPQVHEVSINLLSDSYFASLLNNGSLKVLSVEESELKEFGEEKFELLAGTLKKHLMDVFEKLEREKQSSQAPVKSFSFAPPPKSEEELQAELEAKEKADKEAAELKEKEEAELKAAQLDAAKKELAELEAKEKPSKKDEKRIAELLKIVGE